MITFIAIFMSRLVPKLTRRVPYRLQAPCATANVGHVNINAHTQSVAYKLSVPALLKGTPNVSFTLPEFVHRVARHYKL